MDKRTIEIITKVFSCKPQHINDINMLKSGMTNHSYVFRIDKKRFIIRVPGEGTQKLINRKQEYDVYQVILPLSICDDLVYFDPDNGYKITVYLENARVCDSSNWEDVHACMKKLKKIHDAKLVVPHHFDVFERINFYESLWSQPSCYTDYTETKANVMKLKKYIDTHSITMSLTHIDAVPDNFLFTPGHDKERIRLIDWEYSAMQDCHLDIAMFAVYAMYEREQVEMLIDCYFDGECASSVRRKIYAYIAMCGLLWSNWCEYKRQFGVEFGEYTLKQYKFAKEYCHI